MQFELYSQMTIAQSMRAIAERMAAKPTSTRPELDGWVEKSGTFSLAVTSKIGRYFSRTTRLSGTVERESGLTVIRGYVSDGVSPYWMRVLYGVLIVVTLGLLAAGEPLLALVALGGGLAAYIPLRGDYVNSDLLLIEIEKTLKASPTPPRKKK
jgi:hypothetical protein